MNNMGQTPADQWAPPWAQLNGFNPKNNLGMEYTVLESYFDNIYQTKQDNTCPKSSHFESKSLSQTRSTNPTLPYGKTGFEADVPLSPINNKTIPKDNVCAKVVESEKNNFEISIAKPIGSVLQCPQEFSLELLGNLLPDVAIKEEPISLQENSRQQGPAISTDWDTQSASAHFDSLKVVSEHLVERIKLEDVCQSGSTYPFCLAQSSSNASYPFGVPSQCQVNGFSQYSGDTSNSSKVPLSCHSGDKNFLLGNKDQGSGNFNLNMNNNLMCTTMFLMNESLQQNGAHQSHNVPRKHHDIFNIACEKGCNCEAANSIFRTGNGLMFAADKHAATKHFMTPCGPLQLTAQECGEFLLKKVASGNSLVNPDAAHINNQNASNESNTAQRKNRQTGVSGNTSVMHQGTSTENGGKLMPLPTGQKYRVAKERPFTCPECGKSFLLKHHLVTHARVHTGERPHICTECGKSFAHKHCLSTHLLLHSSDRPYKCMECKKSFTLKHHLVTHARVHSRDRPFVCQECGRTFPQKRHLVTHVKFHSGERPYVCEECGESFAQKDHLVIHSRFHGGQHPYVCPDCGATFARKFELVNHGRLHGRQPHSCEVCGKEFLQKRTLLAHTRLHVEGDRPFVCQHCGETFARKAELTDHSSIHTEEGKSFVCRECGNCFSNREGLALHYRLHASDRNFVADLCDLATAFQQPTAHFLCPQQPGPPPVNKLTAGPTPSTSAGGLGPQLPKPKPHICPDCGKAFTQKHGLAQHHRRHLNGGCDVRQHACDKCGKAFFQKNHLVLHERQHLEHPRGISVPSLALPPPPSENKTYSVGTSTPTE